MALPTAIPRPLVRLNQWTILLSVILTWVTGVEWILAIPLSANLLGVLFNWQAVGYVFTTMVAIASSVAIAGFCIGCFLHFQLKQWQYRRSLKKAM